MNHDDIESIKQLKYRYLRTLDLKQWDDFADCFLPEATGDYAGLTFADRESLVGYMPENLGEAVAEVVPLLEVEGAEVAVLEALDLLEALQVHDVRLERVLAFTTESSVVLTREPDCSHRLQPV